jgi:hypothetical protein
MYGVYSNILFSLIFWPFESLLLNYTSTEKPNNFTENLIPKRVKLETYLNFRCRCFWIWRYERVYKSTTIEETSNGGLKIHLCELGIEDEENAYEKVSACDGLSGDKDYFFTNLQDAQDFVKENY